MDHKEIVDYENLKEEMIKMGAEPQIFDMPAIRERIENGGIEDIFVNKDGTVDFNGYHMSKIDSKDGEEISLQKLNKIEKVIKDDYLEENEETLYISDAQKIIINEYGIEVKKEEKEYMGKSKEEWEKFSFDNFDNIKKPVKKQYIRKDGLILDYDVETKRYMEFYDDGSWQIDGSIESLISILSSEDGESIKDTLSSFEENARKYTEKYPNLQQYYSNKKNELLDCMDKKQKSLRFENATLKENNQKLQKMLGKTLKFAEKVRNNVVGKIFFGKSANEILGDKDKNLKLLEDGEDR